MKKIKILFLVFGVILLLGLVTTQWVHAQDRVVIAIARSVIGSGGLGGSTGNINISSTLGQPLAGSVGDEGLTSGFWGIVSSLQTWIRQFLPLIIR